MRRPLAAATATAQLAGLAGAAVGMVGFLALILPEAAVPDRAGWVEPEVALWVAVVERAIADSCSQAPGPVREQARRWLTEPNGSLHTILLVGRIRIELVARQGGAGAAAALEAHGRQRGARWTAIPAPAAPVGASAAAAVLSHPQTPWRRRARAHPRPQAGHKGWPTRNSSQS